MRKQARIQDSGVCGGGGTRIHPDLNKFVRSRSELGSRNCRLVTEIGSHLQSCLANNLAVVVDTTVSKLAEASLPHAAHLHRNTTVTDGLYLYVDHQGAL